MNRFIWGCALMLALASLLFDAPSAGAADKANVHAESLRCTRAAIGYAKATTADIGACKASSYRAGGHCPRGSSTLIVRVGKQNYALRSGQKPIRLGQNYRMEALTQACGFPKMPLATVPSTTSSHAPGLGIQVGTGPLATYGVQAQASPGTCHYTYFSAFPRPDPRCTPGAINPQVTQADIDSTICRSGYTSKIRPPESVTAKEKISSAAAYGYAGSLHTAEYDHLISLELGGDPNDASNLWVEPNDRPNATSVYNTKDALESTLNELVCSGQITLVAAQHAIATNWVAAYEKYDGP